MDRFAAAVLLLVALLPGMALGDDADMRQLGEDAANYAMSELGFEKGDLNVLAITNAGYAVVDGQTTDICLDAIMEVAGCTPGRHNLVNVQNAPWKTLWFGFFNKETGYAVYMKANEDATGFEIQEKERIDADYVLDNVDSWVPGVFGHMLPIANIWAHENTPYIFMRAVDLHNHLCPGVSSGFLEAKYVEKELPIEDPLNQSYKVISCPCWCKEDAFQVMWDATPGKRGMYVKHISEVERVGLRDKYGGIDVAGIFIRWDGSTNTGDGLVLGFNWTKAQDLSNADTWPSWAYRLKEDEILMDSAKTPEDFVSTIMEFHLYNVDELQALEGAGLNPLKVLGVENGGH